MTPSMRLSAIKASYGSHAGLAEMIHRDLEEAFALGHAFGIERAADVADLESAKRIQKLKVVRPSPVATIDKDFL